MCNSLTSAPKLWFSTPNHRSVAFQSDNQHDCEGGGSACPDSMGFSGNRIPVEMFVQQVNTGVIRDVCLNQDTFLNSIGEYTVALGARMVVLDVQASRLLSYFRIPYAPKNLKVRFPEWPVGVFERTIALLLALDVLSSPQKQHTGIAQGESETLAAWLHLTNQCNLSCKYCYVNQSNQRMDISTAQRSVDAIFRSALAHGYTRIKLKYAGGEPTLNFDVLRAAQQRAEVLSAQTSINLEAVMLTNGVHIADDQIDALLAHNIRVMVSLDGVGQYQDIQRPLRGHDGSSFELVTHTLDRLLARGISPNISTTITKQSIGGLPELVEYLLDRELQFGFNFYRELDDSSEHDELVFTSDQMIEGLQAAFQAVERRLPKYSLVSALADRANLGIPHLRTCGVGRNYMVIDCKGNISRCQMDMEHPVTTIAADDPLVLVRANTNGIQNLAVDQKECQECIWRYRCTGGCPRLTFQRTGRYDAKSPLCDVYRAILPEVVRLEALRLLKYEEPWDFLIH
jgi:uncharacterized protein